MEMQRLPANTEVQNIPLCKIKAMVFWDAEGILLVDFLTRGETINVAHYCNMLNKEKLFQPTGQNVMSSIFMTMWNHPRWSYSGSSSTDGKCCSIHYKVHTQHLGISIFGHLRWSLARQWFQSDNDIVTGGINWFHASTWTLLLRLLT